MALMSETTPLIPLSVVGALWDLTAAPSSSNYCTFRVCTEAQQGLCTYFIAKSCLEFTGLKNRRNKVVLTSFLHKR
jgi:hypothetical protein